MSNPVEQLMGSVAEALKSDGFETVESNEGGMVTAVLDSETSVAVGVAPIEAEGGLAALKVSSYAGVNLDIDDGAAAMKLLSTLNSLNEVSNIGKWSYRPKQGVIALDQTVLLEGLSPEELIAVVRIIEGLADYHDDRLVEFLGTGQSMADAARAAAQQAAI